MSQRRSRCFRSGSCPCLDQKRISSRKLSQRRHSVSAGVSKCLCQQLGPCSCPDQKPVSPRNYPPQLLSPPSLRSSYFQSSIFWFPSPKSFDRLQDGERVQNKIVMKHSDCELHTNEAPFSCFSLFSLTPGKLHK